MIHYVPPEMQELPPTEQAAIRTLESAQPNPEQPYTGNATSTLDPRPSSSRIVPVNSATPRSGVMQRSPSPIDDAGPPKYTATGRVSKATKGRRIHHCDECGKIYTRAEHLRRHQQNHKPGAFPCNIPGCGRSFFREDLLERHKARHNDPQDPPQPASIGSDHSTTGLERASAPNVSQKTAFTHALTGADNDSGAVSDDLPQDVPTGTVLRSTATRIPARKQGYLPLTQLPLQAPIAVDTSTTPSGIPFCGPLDFPPPCSPGGYGSPDEDYSLRGGPYYGQPQLAGLGTTSSVDYLREFMHPSSSRSPVSVGSSNVYSQLIGPSGQCVPCYADSSSSDDACGSEPCVYAFDDAGFMSVSHNGPSHMTNVDERDANEVHELSVPLMPPLSMENNCLATSDQRYLDAYWRWIHPMFPIVHKPSFDLETASPLLRSAMLALGAHIPQMPTDSENARLVHERCMKVLKKRTIASLHTYRVSDMQAIFLVEVYSLFLSRRPPLQVSKSFEDLVRILTAELEYASFGNSMSPHDSQVGDVSDGMSSTHWNSKYKQRLLLSCYLLDQQQALLFGRPRTDCITALLNSDLPWPRSQAYWDSPWNIQAELDCCESTEGAPCCDRLSEALYALTSTTTHQLDAFQSQIMLAGICGPLNIPETNEYEFHRALMQTNLPHKVAQEPRMIMAYHTAMLCKHTPIRDLLAVAGESWVMAEKLGSQDEYARSQLVAREWARGSGGAAISGDGPSVLRSTHHALCILDVQSKHCKTGLIYQEWALYLAAVVLWARAYVLDVEGQGETRCTRHSLAEPGTDAVELEQAVTDFIGNNGSTLGWVEAKKILLWTKAKIERSIVPHNCGLTSNALDVLSKLCARGNEQEWFGA